MIEIFCPNCGKLILDQPICPSCDWRRPVSDEGVGQAVWQADLGTRLNKPHCYPVVAQGRYCLGTEDGTLLALNVEDGAFEWEYALDSGCMAHALATDGERLFVGCEDVNPIPSPGKSLLALDALNGEAMWQFSITAHSLSAPAVVGDTLYLITSGGFLHAVDAGTGEARWRVEHPLWGPSAPAVGEGVVCAGGRGGKLAAYATGSQVELWCHTADGWFAAPPVIDGGRVYALCWDDHLYALNAQTGRLVWKVEGERSRGWTSPFVVCDEHIFIGSRVYREDGSRGYAMLALRAEDGGERWRFFTERHIYTPPTLAEEALFFGSNDGFFYAVDAETGTERWRVQVKSRAVTKPQVTGDVVIFGGRDGMVHAVRWRVERDEEPLSPDVYLEQGRFAEAAAVYALEGDLARAADIYAGQAKHCESAALYEKAGHLSKAASAWSLCGDLNRALALFLEAGDKLGQAQTLVKLGEFLRAAELYEQIGNVKDAADCYLEGDDRLRAIKLYAEVGETERAIEIAEDVGDWEKQVDLLVKQGRLSEGADILADHGVLERAAILYEEANELERALALEQRLERWSRVADLAERVGQYELIGAAHEKLGHPLQAAGAYVRAGRQAAEEEPLDEEKVASLYQQAASLFEKIFEEEKAAACYRQVVKYRRLPEVEVRVIPQGPFVEYQFNTVTLEVTNIGYGIASDINIQLEGKFDVDGDCCVRGLPSQRTKKLIVTVRPHKEQYGRLMLGIVVTYQDRNRREYDFQGSTIVEVSPDEFLPGITRGMTPPQIVIQEYYQPGARRIEGDEVHSGGQVGDRVEIRREGIGQSPRRRSEEKDRVVGDRVEIDRAAGDRLVLEDEEGVQVRRVGPVRRCPVCNLPTQDPDQRYCSDCGAPLDDQNG